MQRLCLVSNPRVCKGILFSLFPCNSINTYCVFKGYPQIYSWKPHRNISAIYQVFDKWEDAFSLINQWNLWCSSFPLSAFDYSRHPLYFLHSPGGPRQKYWLVNMQGPLYLLDFSSFRLMVGS